MKGKKPQFINRELSWLEFNQRVLGEALDDSVPLLERLKFLCITTSNLDEFFMVRVGALELLHAEGVKKRDPSGLTPYRQLQGIGKRVRRMVQDQYQCYSTRLEPELAEHGIVRITPDEASEEQLEYARSYFEREVLPVVTPMAATREHFPYLADLGLQIAVRLKPGVDSAECRVAIIPVGKCLGRIVSVPADKGFAYMLIEDVIRTSVDQLFPGIPVVETVAFRITRNADLTVQDDEAADFLAEMQEVLKARKRSGCVRFEVEDKATRTLRDFIQKGIGILPRAVCPVTGPIHLGDLMGLTELDEFNALRYEPWVPQPSPQVDLGNSIFDEIAAGDILLCHPYDSFEPVLKLVQEASTDPDVLAIKQVLYRTSADSPVVQALRLAAERGKYVTALVELKARFDEARNIEWARQLEEAGVQVIYGVKGLKTHAKVCLVVRREASGVVRYVQFGTGNYNEKTARVYSDISYMTCDEDLGADATAFFNAVSGYSEPQRFRKLEMAPIGLRERIVALVENEAALKEDGLDACIMAKMNSLADTEVIAALYKASQKGVPVKLNVRGVCCLRPGVKGLSDHVTTVSIVDRFLEHSRIIYFRHGGDEQVFISSADWMPRNLRRRVELLVPIEDPRCRRRLVSILEAYFRDNVKAHTLLADGSYERPDPPRGAARFQSQEALYGESVEAAASADATRRRTFQPLTAPGKGT